MTIDRFCFSPVLILKVGGRLRCIGSPQHLKTRFGNHLELEVCHDSKINDLYFEGVNLNE